MPAELKKIFKFLRADKKMKIAAVFRRFKVKLGVIIVIAEGATENLGYFTREQNITIIFKFLPGLPLLTPMEFIGF